MTTTPTRAERPGSGRAPLTQRTEVLLRPDPRRVVTQLFLPGQEWAGTSRAANVVARCLSISDADVDAELARILDDHGSRHRRFTEILDEHFSAVAHRINAAVTLSAARRRLIGAYFTQEYALESAALFNPSLVVHPQQGPDPSRLRFVMSARAVGEGHLSSIVFRTGEMTLPEPATGDGHHGGARIVLEPGSVLATAGTHRRDLIDRERLRHQATAVGVDAESLRFVLSDLPDVFATEALEGVLSRLRTQQLTRVHAERTVTSLRRTADASYQVEFDPETDLSERALLPWAPAESRGMEDARFVQFTEDDATVTYLATYTAYDGTCVAPTRLQSDDLRTFRASPLTGAAATDKGLSLFPRRVGGRYLALSRWDRENNALAFSDDGYHWDGAVEIQSPRRPWELIQVGNCGSPLETAEGWLVFTHGVGPMRRYSLGAILLDLDDPSRVRGRLQDPLLQPAPDERDGYVPNVVYSCGALRHGRTVLLPYGCSDSSIRMTLVDLPELLARLLAPAGT